MRLTPVPVSLVQGSLAWLEWRGTGIGSSDAPVIIGIDPWCGPHQLFERKLGLEPPQEQTRAMRRGTELEEEARFIFEIGQGRTFPPQCFTCMEYPFMKVSLDGLCGVDIFENKAPGKDSHRKYLKHGAPDHYLAQMQYQMAVADCERVFFQSYNPDFPEGKQVVLKEVWRDERYIDWLLERVIVFWECLTSGKDLDEGLLARSLT